MEKQLIKKMILHTLFTFETILVIASPKNCRLAILADVAQAVTALWL